MSDYIIGLLWNSFVPVKIKIFFLWNQLWAAQLNMTVNMKILT